VAFVLDLGRALHAHGLPAHRLEDVLEKMSRGLGLEGQFFSQPTSIFAAFGPQAEQRTHLIRVEPGEVQLERMAEIDGLAGAVLRGELAPAAARARLAAVIAAPPRYRVGIVLAAAAIASAAAARFLGGGAVEVVVGAALGACVALVGAAVDRPGRRGLFEPLAAFAAATIASLAAHAFGPFAVRIATLAGMILLIPGLTLATAMTELSSRHLASGTARMSGAMVVFLGIAFGVATGGAAVERLLGPAPAGAGVALPGWTEGLALLLAPPAIGVLLRAAPRDLPWVLGVGVSAFLAGRAGAAALGPELGLFAAALVAGLAGNAYARRLDRPSAVPLVPAILLVVPGSVGFRSLASLLDREVVMGVDTAFRMVLMLTALVAGLLAANALLPSRRAVGGA
jgi:uncharacterized membrane protein YjjP (DUF1212 family)